MPKTSRNIVTHTPGPWRAEFPDRGVLEMSSVFAPALNDGDDPWRVAYVLRETNPHQRLIDDANARLIAAAPELLAALKQLDGILGVSVHSANREMVRLVVERARAAIAKAEWGAK